MRLPVLFVVLLLLSCLCTVVTPRPSARSLTSSFVRSSKVAMDMPLDADVFQAPPGFNAPQQVHITQGDVEGRAVTVSWITPEGPGSSVVNYGPEKNKYTFAAEAQVITCYSAYKYTSGYIHHCTLSNLAYNTLYFYKLGEGKYAREFSFTTPPEAGPDVPYTFGLIGDLGQTEDSNRTLQHYLRSKGQAVLFVGDCSYVDKYPYYNNNRWDTWGRFVELSTAYQPWFWSAGNHDIETDISFGEVDEFKAYTHHLATSYKFSNNTSPLWYSFQSGPAYVIVLSSYSSFVKYSPQYNWLNLEFPKVDREKTPWLIIVMHNSFYSTNSVHYLEGEAMRHVFEPWFTKYKVDIVFSGHVHAYERSSGVSKVSLNSTNGLCEPVLDDDAPTYIVIGDGGNVEGLAQSYLYPQPAFSAFREASFGHGILDIKNRTDALLSWHRNQDGLAMVGDSHWFKNQYWKSLKPKYIECDIFSS